MEMLTKLISNPIINISVSLFFGLVLAKYAYKINYFNKKRYKKYLRRKFSMMYVTLFQRRDAYFAGFIIRTGLAVSTSGAMLILWLGGFLLTLHKSSVPDPRLYQAAQVVLVAMSVMTTYLHASLLLRLFAETRVLLRPRPAIEKLREELLRSDKRELLNDRELEEFTKSLDRLEADLTYLKAMTVKPPHWATQVPDGEKLAPSENATPAQ